MTFSAARSRSRVLTPGRILAASRLIVLTRMSPVAAMRSISSGVFLMITVLRAYSGALEILLQPEGGDHGPNVVMDIGRLAGAIDPAQKAPLVVIVDHGGGFLVVHPQPVLNHIGLVIVALDQPRAVL